MANFVSLPLASGGFAPVNPDQVDAVVDVPANLNPGPPACYVVLIAAAGRGQLVASGTAAAVAALLGAPAPGTTSQAPLLFSGLTVGSGATNITRLCNDAQEHVAGIQDIAYPSRAARLRRIAANVYINSLVLGLSIRVLVNGAPQGTLAFLPGVTGVAHGDIDVAVADDDLVAVEMEQASPTGTAEVCVTIERSDP